MKRFLIGFLALSALFSACSREMKDPSIQTVSGAVLESLDSAPTLTLTDDDFAEVNLTCDEELDECRIYLGEAGEIGILRLDEDGNAAAVEQAVKEYLDRESRSTTSLLELYPSEVLEERLAHYQGATVVHRGRYVCYFALSREENEKAKKAFLDAI